MQDQFAAGRHPAASGNVGSTRLPIVDLAVTSDLASVADTWRGFEREADGTAFQAFEWLESWQRCVGEPSGVRPAIVVGRFADGRPAFLLPLAIESSRVVRRLVFLGRALCDYNAPLLSPDFAGAIPPAGHAAWWSSVLDLLGRHPEFRHDMVLLDKMPRLVGGQVNPLASLSSAPHPSRAYRARLGTDWDQFYFEKRSSATRRRERNKRKKLGEMGELRFVTLSDPDEITATLDILFEQKGAALAAMGVPNFFTRPGYRAFFLDVARRPDSIVHVSRLDVGGRPAAINLGVLFGSSYYHVLASYDAGPTSRFGPGVVHLHELMRHAIQNRCEWMDFTIGDERYKDEWSDEVSDLLDHVSLTNWRGVPFALEAAARRRAKHVIKRSRWLMPMAERLRAVPHALSSALGTRLAGSRPGDAA
jgi:CelD/BcsL family acetyltransferase involved in cellulose biosynthesis